MNNPFAAKAPLDVMAVLFARGDLEPTFDWPEKWQDEHASRFTVAKSSGFDILKDIHSAFSNAVANGETGASFAKKLRPILEAKGWWGRKLVIDPASGEKRVVQLGSPRRLEIIFDTNMRVSYAAGHWAAFERGKKDRPFLRYVALLDDDTRPAHRARHNLVLPVDHPYWNLWAPPCGWNCRCTLQSLSQSDVNRLVREGEDLFYEPEADTLRSYVNRRTGEVSKVPDGIDPGWAYNPGKAGTRAALSATAKLLDAPPALSAVINDDSEWLSRLLGREFEDWFDVAAAGGPNDRPVVVIGALRQNVLAQLNARGINPSSGAITVSQTEIRHMMRDTKVDAGKAVPLDTLKRLPALLTEPKAVLLDNENGNLIYVFDANDSAGKIIVRMDFKAARRVELSNVKFISNSVRTASLVPSASLRNRGAYTVLEGIV